MNIPSSDETKKRVLVTGAYGLIGNLVYAHLEDQPDRYEPYALSRRLHPSNRATQPGFRPIPEDRLRLADLTSLEAVQQALTGIDTVVHMAADPDASAGWESVLNNNIIGSYNLLEAARLEGVRRVLYASTNMVSFGYLMEEPYSLLRNWQPGSDLPQVDYTPVDHAMPTRPTTYYACSKVFGEGLAHMYAQVHGISCICLRIGWVVAEDRPPHPGARILWCSHRDCLQLVERAIQAPDSLRFDIFYVQSANAQNFVDIQHARDVLGYQPQDRAEDYL